MMMMRCLRNIGEQTNHSLTRDVEGASTKVRHQHLELTVGRPVELG
jgi:hypothetical protein